MIGYLLQSFAASAAQPLPDPPTPSQMYRALMRLTMVPQQETDGRLIAPVSGRTVSPAVRAAAHSADS